MKRIIIVFIICFFLEFPFVLAQAPFSRGVNLTGWFQAGSARQVHFTKFSKKDFINIKSLGCDVVRLPINLHYMTSGEPDFTLDTLFLNFLDEVVDWTEELEMHLILDNHTFDPSKDTEPEVENALLKIWPQMAEHFKNRSAYLYYEVLNEPHGISDGKWNAIQQNVIDAIRKIDKKHTIVIGPAGWNSYNNLDKMPEYEDDNLIYTFHFYDPFLFTHQGASWTTPSMVPLSGVPFPYEESKMPEFPGELKDTWIESNFNNYQNHGTVQEVKRLLDMAIKFKEERNVPLFCGEFGVYIPNSDPVERANWYEIVRKYLEENGISWTIWDYTGGFGIFEEGGNDMFEYDVDTSVVKGLGLNVPEQGEFNMQPDTTGFDVYKDYIQKNIVESSYSAEGTIDFYFDQLPNNGNYCIYWSGSERYGNTSFGFKPYKDLSILKENGYALDFFLRGLGVERSIDVRFVDTKTSEPDDHPWRIRITLSESDIPWNGKWKHFHLPLNDFVEHGAWDDGWFNPEGKFNWKAIKKLEFVAEHSELKDSHLWIDQIVLTSVDTATVNDTSAFEFQVGDTTGTGDTAVHMSNVKSGCLKVFPNPAQEYITLNLQELKNFDIFDHTGRLVKTYFPVYRNKQFTTINVSSLQKGIYIINVTNSSGEFFYVKFLILK